MKVLGVISAEGYECRISEDVHGRVHFTADADIDADYIVVEIARHVLGANWLPEYVQKANAGGIERVLV